MKTKTSELSGPALDWAAPPTGEKPHRFMAVARRLWLQSSPTSAGCREWTGKRNEHGYGKCRVGGIERRAHRVMFFELHPLADRNLVVRHTCDNPACIKPGHLVLGTVRENMQDMHARGRFGGGAKSGNKNALGNVGWTKGGAVFNRMRASKLGDEVDVPEELVR